MEWAQVGIYCVVQILAGIAAGVCYLALFGFSFSLGPAIIVILTLAPNMDYLRISWTCTVFLHIYHTCLFIDISIGFGRMHDELLQKLAQGISLNSHHDMLSVFSNSQTSGLAPVGSFLPQACQRRRKLTPLLERYNHEVERRSFR